MENNAVKQKVIIVYFSPSGTTLKSLKNIAAGMGDVDIEYLDMSVVGNRKKIHSFKETDIVLYGTITGAVLFAPNKEIFASMRGNGAYFVGIAQYGNGYYGVTLKQLQRRAVKCGFRVLALGAFIGQHSGNKSVATARPDAKDAQIQEQFGRDIMKKISTGRSKLTAEPGIGWSVSPLYNLVVNLRRLQMDSDYTLPAMCKSKKINSEKCIKCRACERNCPMQAIDFETQKFDLDKCIGCYRCVNRCPKQAIEVTSSVMNHIMMDFAKRAGNVKRQEPTIIL